MGRRKGSKNGINAYLEWRRLYQCHHDMMHRCYNPNKFQFERYGGRGIIVCDEWQDYDAFELWAINNGYTDEMSIERKDVNGPYSPNNCSWIPLSEQALNTSRSHLIQAFGETKSIAAWIKDPRCVVTYYVLRSRIRYGWDTEQALMTVASPNTKKGIHRG